MQCDHGSQPFCSSYGLPTAVQMSPEPNAIRAATSRSNLAVASALTHVPDKRMEPLWSRKCHENEMGCTDIMAVCLYSQSLMV